MINKLSLYNAFVYAVCQSSWKTVDILICRTSRVHRFYYF